MIKLWRIALTEYRQNVLKKRFILVLLSVPLMISVGVGMGFLLESLQNNDLPVGYVDLAGVFATVVPAPVAAEADRVTFIPYPTADDAHAALAAGQIQAYYVVTADYQKTRRVDLVYIKRPGENARRQFYDFLQINLSSELPPEIAYRIAAGTEITVRSADGRRTVPNAGPTFGLLMPLFINLAFLALLLITSGYLMGTVAEEKENRTMEILVTSLSPWQLIGGKVLGVVAIGFTLLLTWAIIVVTGISVAARVGIGWFQNLGMDWRIVLATAIIAVPAYVLVAALMTAIGAMATSTQEGQSISAIFVILHMIPLYVGFAFINTPNSPLAVTLSLLPFTSLMTVAMRNLATAVPPWQVAASAGIQTAAALGALWLASRAFRLGMLRYGQRLSWRRLLRTGN